VLSMDIVSMFWMLKLKMDRIGAGIGVAMGSSDAEKMDVVSHRRYATSGQWCRSGHVRTGGSWSIIMCGVEQLRCAIETPSVGLHSWVKMLFVDFAFVGCLTL
jgi:hypothetical protein